MVDFKLSDSEQALFDRAMEFSRKEIVPNAIEFDRADEIPVDLCQKAFEAGFMNCHFPKDLGGPGLSMVDETLIFQAMGYGDPGCATSINVNNLAFAPLLIGATKEQLKKYVAPLVTGDKVKFGAFALTEREAGSDAAATQTTAVKDGDEWVINGRKCWSTNAPNADLFTVFTQTQPGSGYKGMAVFMVPKEFGPEIGHIEHKIGQRASQQSEVIFKDVRVPEDCLVGEVGKGFHIAMQTLDKTRTGIASIACGVCQRAVDEAARFANKRIQFGKPIGKFQGISFKLAELAARAEAAKLLTRYAAWQVDNKIPNSYNSAIAKWKASEWAMQSMVDAIQVFGGFGYAEEYGLGVLFRGAKLLEIYEGTNEVQRIVIANALKKHGEQTNSGFKLKYEGVDAPNPWED